MLPLLSQLLERQRTAAVHISANRELVVIQDLIQTEFVVDSDHILLRCMLAQSAYLIGAKLNINPHIISGQIDVWLKQKRSEGTYMSAGMTPQDIIDSLDGQTLTLGKQRLNLSVAFREFHTSVEMIHAIDTGHPVLIPYNNDSAFSKSIENFEQETGHVDAAALELDDNEEMGPDYHVLLAVGYDKAERVFILRDNRSKYLYKGYVKAPFSAIDKHITVAGTFDVAAKLVR